LLSCALVVFGQHFQEHPRGAAPNARSASFLGWAPLRLLVAPQESELALRSAVRFLTPRVFPYQLVSCSLVAFGQHFQEHPRGAAPNVRSGSFLEVAAALARCAAGEQLSLALC